MQLFPIHKYVDEVETGLFMTEDESVEMSLDLLDSHLQFLGAISPQGIRLYVSWTKLDLHVIAGHFLSRQSLH